MGTITAHFVQLAAGGGEDTFWIHLLMLVTLAAGAGIYTLARSRAKRFRRQADDETLEDVIGGKQSDWPAPAGTIKLGRHVVLHRRRDLKSGMELLDGFFLVEVVEDTAAGDKLDIEMRSMCFNELMRRGALGAVSSEALTEYTLDKEGNFGKSIRCEAMAQLAGRTRKQDTDLQDTGQQANRVISHPDGTAFQKT